MPPVWPWFRLCLIMENTIGPTEILSNNPRVIPFSKASIITGKYKIIKSCRGNSMNDENFSECSN
jgi:hypothetical protein